MSNVTENLIRYARINTRADENNPEAPSSEGQWTLAGMLKEELEELGLTTSLDDHCYLFGYLPANTDKKVKTVGFLAHLDTADFNAEGVNPRIIKYEGGDIVLNEEKNIIMRVEDFPNMNNYKGNSLVVTDGTTLLGADDKAGIAEIMAGLKIIVNDPSIKHGPIHVAFTPDEEIGRGPALFDIEKFNADFGYTFDGGPVGELEYENFNAASAKVTIEGVSVHPGTAKNKMKNAITLGRQFDEMLPQLERPEYTDGYEGFYLMTEFTGAIDHAELHYILRDFDARGLEVRKETVLKAVEEMNRRYGKDTVSAEIRDSYRNMREKVEPHKYVIDFARKAMEDAGITPIIKPIRGGTDGAQLSYKGLPCPNIFVGGENFHGQYEFIASEAMEQAVEVMLNIVKGVYEA